MRSSLAVSAILTSCALATNIVLVNDDGWAEMNIRQFYDVLTAAGESVIISAPAINESGTGTLSECLRHMYAERNEQVPSKARLQPSRMAATLTAVLPTARPRVTTVPIRT